MVSFRLELCFPPGEKVLGFIGGFGMSQFNLSGPFTNRRKKLNPLEAFETYWPLWVADEQGLIDPYYEKIENPIEIFL